MGHLHRPHCPHRLLYGALADLLYLRVLRVLPPYITLKLLFFSYLRMAPRSELTPALRERICELYSAAGWGYRRIQKRYPWVSISGIRYTVKKDRERLGGVTKQRSGRPKKLDEADRERLLNAIDENPKITREDMLAKVSHKVKSF